MNAIGFDDRQAAEFRNDIDRGTHFVEPKTPTGDNFLVAAGVKVGEAFRKFDRLSIDRYRTKRRFLSPHTLGQIVAIDREKPADIGALAFERTRGPYRLPEMGLVAADAPENEAQHVEKMDADIGRHSTRLAVIALPGGVIPLAARGNVGEFDLVPHVALREPIAQRDDRRMQPKLQDGGYPATGVTLDLRQAVDVARIKGQRLFADGVGAGAHRITAMGVVKVVRRTDRGVIDFFAAAAKLVNVTIELLESDEKLRIGKMAVQDADGVVWIIGGNEISAGFRDRPHVPGRNVTGGADKSIGCQRLSPVCKNWRPAGPTGSRQLRFPNPSASQSSRTAGQNPSRPEARR
jgi:hypothetical protein